ncbi:MAG: TfoX/Sxy family protein [Actinomycetota bacterium]|nr:TfoX/Sxy family protein [Actinomycetota bacterium]
MKMFGGLAFLVGGNIAVDASGQGGVLVRVEPSSSVAPLKRTKAQPMVMRGREMPGWLQVDSADVRTNRQLLGWVERGVDYARSLPSKR